MSNLNELTLKQVKKIECHLTRLAILHRTAAQLSKSISQDKDLLIMLMRENKINLIYGDGLFPIILSKVNGKYKVYSDIKDLKNENEVYFNTPKGYLESKINKMNCCFKEYELDEIFNTLVSLFPEYATTELIDIYSDHIGKYQAFPID